MLSSPVTHSTDFSSLSFRDSRATSTSCRYSPARDFSPDATVPQGVYTYRLRCRFNDNRIVTRVGTVLLLR